MEVKNLSDEEKKTIIYGIINDFHKIGRDPVDTYMERVEDFCLQVFNKYFNDVTPINKIETI